MKFRIEHGATPGSSLGVAVVFELEDIPKLRAMIDAVEGSAGHKAHPAPYVPLYRQHGIDPETMYPQATRKGNDVGREET